MDRRTFIARGISWCGAASGLAATGCGTLLHRERVGAAPSRDIDWQVAALNGLGLAFFFVPGVVAFAVDFYTGAIYLPPEAGALEPGPGEALSQSFRKQQIPTADVLEQSVVEGVVSRHVGQPVSLNQSDSRVSSLKKLDDFGANLRHHQQDRRFGERPVDFFTTMRANPVRHGRAA